MKRITYFLISGLLLTLLVLGACEKVVYPPVEKPTDVSYSEDVQPIFDAKCVQCHKGGLAPDLRPENSYNALINGGYVDTQNPEESILMTTLYGSHDSRATEAEKQTILAWIEEGAKNN